MMRRSLPDLDGDCSPALHAGRRADGRQSGSQVRPTDRATVRQVGTGQSGRDLSFDLPASTCIAIRTGQTPRRRHSPAVGAPYQSVATPTVFLPVDRSDTGPAVFPHRSSSRRPTPISPRCGRSRWHGRLRRATGGALLHAGVASFFSWARVDRCAGMFLHRNEPGSHAMQDDAESLGSVASIVGLLRHEWDHDRGGLHEGAKGLQGCADGYC